MRQRGDGRARASGWGLRLAALITCAFAFFALSAAPASAGSLKLGMVFKYLVRHPHVHGPIDAAAPSLDGVVITAPWVFAQQTCKMIDGGNWDWSRYDEVFGYLAEKDLDVTLKISEGPDCASVRPGSQPKAGYLREWGVFARKMVQRYPLVEEVEVWSEQNLSGNDWAGGQAAYAKAFLAVEREVGDRAEVLIGGIGFCCGPVTWFRELFDGRRELRRKTEAVAVHSYSPSPETALRRLRGVRRVIPRGADLYITEHGWSTCPVPTETSQRKCVTEGEQAAQMREYVKLLRANKRPLDLRKFFWFQSQDFNSVDAALACPTDHNDFYGIWDYYGNPKPSKYVWENLTQAVLPEAIPKAGMRRAC